MGISASSSKGRGHSVMSQPTCIKLVHGQDRTTSCDILLYGATVSSWKIAGREKLYISPKSALDGSKPVRGGIPICFPNFGPWTLGPQHGFARSSNEWTVHHPPQADSDSGDVKAVFLLKDSQATRQVWNYRFQMTFTITLRLSSLQLEVEVTNPGDATLDLTFCFHTYLKVQQLATCHLSNFKGLKYTDKTLDGWPEAEEERENVIVTDFTDRVYRDAPNTIHVSDNGLDLTMTKEGMCDWVVWNPGKDHKMGDLPVEDVHKFICVEAAQASKRIYLEKDQTWSATHVITQRN